MGVGVGGALNTLTTLRERAWGCSCGHSPVPCRAPCTHPSYLYSTHGVACVHNQTTCSG